MGKKDILASTIISTVLLLSSSCTPAPLVEFVRVNETVVGNFPDGTRCTIEPDPESVIKRHIVPGYNADQTLSLVAQEILSQPQIRDGKVKNCTAYPPPTIFNSEPHRFSRNLVKPILTPQAQISSRATYIPTRLSR